MHDIAAEKPPDYDSAWYFADKGYILARFCGRTSATLSYRTV